jgi:hypothetical protein
MLKYLGTTVTNQNLIQERNPYRLSVEKRPLYKDQHIGGWMILRWILERWDGVMWTGSTAMFE